MPTYTDAELEAMLDAGESDLVEFKPHWKKDAKWAGYKTVCAFLNDFPDHQRGAFFSLA